MTNEILDPPKFSVDHLKQYFGAATRNAPASRVVRHFYALAAQAGVGIDAWKRRFSEAVNFGALQRSRPSQKLGDLYGIEAPDSERLLFAVHTYYALFIKLLISRFAGFGAEYDDVRDLCRRLESEESWRIHGLADFLEDSHFSWYLDAWEAETATVLKAVIAGFQEFDLSTGGEDHDLLRPIYQSLLPGAVRHALGEFYTPRWLAQMTLDEVGYDGDPGHRVLDPACGSGVFLMAAIDTIKTKNSGADPRELVRQITANIIGFDINPLAVLAARANYIVAIKTHFGVVPEGRLPIYRRDAIVGVPDTTTEVDFIVGNPPWVGWQNLPEQQRDAMKPLWESYGLFSLSGTKARLGGGKKDLSMLFLYACCDQYLRQGGKLGFLITGSVFKSKGAGDGFRRFCFDQNDGSTVYLRPLKVHDFTRFQPFDGASTQTTMLVVEKCLTPVEYPVPYRIWEKNRGKLTSVEQAARPVDPDHDASPWLTAPRAAVGGLIKVIGPSDYQAYEGVNSGGLNGCFWVREIEPATDELTLIENLGDVGRIKVDKVRQEVETARVFPLLRSGDLERWCAEPKTSILLGQDPATRSGVPEPVMKRDFPKTYEFFKSFEGDPDDVQRGTLRGRSLFRRYYKPSDPFYSMYGVGPYTMSPWKVCWTRIDTRLRGVVVGPSADGRIVLPQETITFVPVESEEEAHYFCAIFNSSPSDALVRSYATGKGFASAHVMEFISIPGFDSGDKGHRKLSKLSIQAHLAADEDDVETITAVEEEIDELAGQTWGITHTEMAGIRGVTDTQD